MGRQPQCLLCCRCQRMRCWSVALAGILCFSCQVLLSCGGTISVFSPNDLSFFSHRIVLGETVAAIQYCEGTVGVGRQFDVTRLGVFAADVGDELFGRVVVFFPPSFDELGLPEVLQSGGFADGFDGCGVPLFMAQGAEAENGDAWP